MTDVATTVAAPITTAPTTQAPAAPATSGTNAPSGQETPKAVSTPDPKPELFEMKVNGKTVRMTRDEMVRRAQLAAGADERFEQAAAKEKHVTGILSRAKSNPIGALMEAGLTKDEAREAFESWYSTEYIEPEALTKEQRDLKAAQDELKRYRTLEKEYKERLKAEQEEQEVSVQRELIQKQIIEAMDSHKLPRSKFTVSRIAFYMRQAAQKGFEAPMDLIIQQVKQERADLVSNNVQDADYSGLIDIFGEDVIKRIISEHLKHVRGNRQKANPSLFSDTTKVDENRSTGKISMAEADAKLKRLMGRA